MKILTPLLPPLPQLWLVSAKQPKCFPIYLETVETFLRQIVLSLFSSHLHLPPSNFFRFLLGLTHGEGPASRQHMDNSKKFLSFFFWGFSFNNYIFGATHGSSPKEGTGTQWLKDINLSLLSWFEKTSVDCWKRKGCISFQCCKYMSMGLLLWGCVNIRSFVVFLFEHVFGQTDWICLS